MPICSAPTGTPRWAARMDAAGVGLSGMEAGHCSTKGAPWNAVAGVVEAGERTAEALHARKHASWDLAVLEDEFRGDARLQRMLPFISGAVNPGSSFSTMKPRMTPSSWPKPRRGRRRCRVIHILAPLRR